MRPIISNRAFIPAKMLTPQECSDLRGELLFEIDMPDALRPGVINHVEVDEFRDAPKGFSIPRAFAMRRFPAMPWRDATSAPSAPCSTPKPISPRDGEQAAFFSVLQSIASQRGPVDSIAIATTGAGKTVSMIYLGSLLKTSTLIVVDSNKLANGFVKECVKFFGQEWTDKYVGRVQQDTVDYVGRYFVVTLAQSLNSRKYPRDFYRAFGLVCYDEIQVFGSPTFSRTLSMFAARVRVGFTAELGTGTQTRIIRSHLGNTKAKSKQEVMHPCAWILNFKHKDERGFTHTPDALDYLSRHETRNNKLATLIAERGYKRGRYVLALSERTNQLLKIRDLLIARGVPENEIGIHAAKYKTERCVVYYSYSFDGKRQRLCVADTIAQGRYIASRLKSGQTVPNLIMPTALQERLKKGELVFYSTRRETYSPDHSELDNITNFCHITLATYKIFQKGVNVPRLDMGVELTPWGNIKQPLGRILRVVDGKETPEWYAVHDSVENDNLFKVCNGEFLNRLCEARTSARMKALRLAKAKVKLQ